MEKETDTIMADAMKRAGVNPSSGDWKGEVAKARKREKWQKYELEILKRIGDGKNPTPEEVENILPGRTYSGTLFALNLLRKDGHIKYARPNSAKKRFHIPSDARVSFGNAPTTSFSKADKMWQAADEKILIRLFSGRKFNPSAEEIAKAFPYKTHLAVMAHANGMRRAGKLSYPSHRHDPRGREVPHFRVSHMKHAKKRKFRRARQPHPSIWKMLDGIPASDIILYILGVFLSIVLSILLLKAH